MFITFSIFNENYCNFFLGRENIFGHDLHATDFEFSEFFHVLHMFKVEKGPKSAKTAPF